MKIKIMKRNIKFWFQRRIRGWSDDECWNLNDVFIEWLNGHLKVYKEQAGKIVDLEFHKFKYKKKEYTQLELIDKLIDLTDEYIDDKTADEKLESIKNEIFDIFKLIFWSMWW